MDNLTNAIFLAFAMFSLVIGLSFAVYLLTNLNNTATTLIQATDKTKDYQLITYDSSNIQTTAAGGAGHVMQTRIVGVDTVISTLYKYYKESFDVEIYDKYNNLNQVFNATIENVLFIKNINLPEYNAYVNEYKEVIGNENAPWVANSNFTKQRIDMYVASQTGYINGQKISYSAEVSNRGPRVGLSELIKNTNGNFREEFIQYNFDGETISDPESESIDTLIGNSKPEDKILIRYTLIDD